MMPSPEAPYNVTGTVDFVQAVVSVKVLGDVLHWLKP